MKTVFLSGKISGDLNYRQKFARAAAMLEAAGYVVLNPATLPDGFDYHAYMRICAAMLAECDAVCFLPCWVDSPGANVECARARAMQKEIFLYDEQGLMERIFSCEKTGYIVFRCFKCERINIYSAKNGDGRGCAYCGGHIKPLGFAKVRVKADE